MALLRRVVSGIVGLLRRARQEQELDAELQEFLDMAIEDKVRVGMSREAATRAAQMELGSAAAVKDGVRDVGWENVLDTTWQDVRYGARTLRRSPGFTAVAVLSLALGIGANTAIFSLINALMLRSLPVSQPEQLVELLSRYPGEPRMSSFSWRHYEHFREHNQSFSDLMAVARGRFQVSGAGLEPETIEGEYVAGNFFTALGVRPALGRLIDAQDDQVDSASAASTVVSWSFWTNRLHADPAIVGKLIVVNDVPATVVGVAPRDFFGLQVGLSPNMWVPAAMEAMIQRPSRRMDGTMSVGMMARLRPGVTIDQALAEMRVLDRYRLEDFAKSRSSAFASGFTIELEPAAAGFAALRDRFAASLLVHHLSNLRNQDFGFERTSLLLVTLDPTHSGYPREQLFAPYQHLLGRLAEIPGVRSVTLSGVTPISGAGASRFIRVEGFEEAADARRYVPLNWVGPRYFETFGTPLVAGRDFAFTDKGGPPVAIVNQAMARYYFGDKDPIGGRFQLVGPSNSGMTGAPPDQVYTIIGVVGDAKYLDLREVPPRTIYLNGFQEPRMFGSRFALKLTGRSAAVAGEVRRIVRDELKTVPVSSVMTMDDLVDASLVPERVIATLSSFFGGLGAALAALGLYGLLACSVTRRTNEIGIRIALGATRANISRMVLRGALGLVCAGLVIGVPLGVLSRRAASRVVTDLPADSLWPLVLATAAMLAIALIAAYVPARRAAKVEPVEALRR